MNEIDLTKAIRHLKPTAEFSFQHADYSTIEWDFLDGDAPTQSELDAAIEQVKASEAQAQLDKAQERAALLEKLGITAEEAALLLA
jgi:hypothetical protein